MAIKNQPKYPIIQGGMGIMVSGPKLAAAVAAEGGIGTIASVGLAASSDGFDLSLGPKKISENNQTILARYIKEAKEASNGGVIAVNCMCALSDYEDLVRTSGSLERRRHRGQLHVRAQRLRRPCAHLVRGGRGRHHLRRGAAAQAAAAHRGAPRYGARPNSQQRQSRGPHHQPLAQALQPHPRRLRRRNAEHRGRTPRRS